MRPMLASRGTSVPSGPDWVHEVKWDGMRVLAEVRNGAVRLFSRNENDVTVSFPELAGLAGVDSDLLLDGEVVALAQVAIERLPAAGVRVGGPFRQVGLQPGGVLPERCSGRLRRRQER